MSGSLNEIPVRSCGYIGLTWVPGSRIGSDIVLPIPIRTRILNITEETYFLHQIKTFPRFLAKIEVMDGRSGERGMLEGIFVELFSWKYGNSQVHMLIYAMQDWSGGCVMRKVCME